MINVKLENITKTFGKTIAVNDLSLDIEAGEFFVLVGPSGCGKTTLLRIIAGLERSDTGNIYFEEKIMNDVSPRDREIGMVFQSYALFPNMKARENIGFSLRIKGVPKEEREKRVKEIASRLRISHLLDRSPLTLSGGEQQRVALARALIKKTNILLLDEPLSNIDAEFRASMRAELKRIHQYLKLTLIYVTHDQLEAMTLADQLAVINKGHLQQVGAPLDVYDHPSNRFVAGFIGTPMMNFLDCELVEVNNKLALDLGFYMISLSGQMEEILKKIDTGSRLTLGIRSEDLKITKIRKKNSVKARVSIIEPVGSQQIIYFEIDGNMVKATASRETQPRIGEEIRIMLNKNAIHLFNKETEKCIF